MRKSAWLSLLMLMSLGLANGQSPTPPKGNDALPCAVVTPACVETLTAAAVAVSDEMRVLNDVLALAKKRRWTTYIDVNALNPITLGLQLFRNAVGAGKMAESRISIKQIELRRVQLREQLRGAIASQLRNLDTAERLTEQNKTLYDAQSALTAILEVGYVSGDLSTEKMIPQWEKRDYYRLSIEQQQRVQADARAALTALITRQP